MLNTWIGRKEKALALQQKQSKIWKHSINLYNCKNTPLELDTEQVDVNFINWYVTNLVPLVYFRDPFIFVKPRNDNWSAFAETVEEGLNYMWEELRLKQQFKKIILSAFLSPPGWIKLGYTAKIGQDIGNLDKIREKTLISKIKNAILGKGEQEAKTPEQMGVLDMNIIEESIFASWIHSHNMLMPPGYHEISKMPWLMEIEDVSILDFKNNPFYKNKGAKPTRDISEKDTGSQITKPSYNYSASGGVDEENQIIRLYHAWDRREQKRLTFSDQDIHFEGKWPYDMDGFPYKPLIFEETLPTEDESNPYPVNAVIPILPQVIEQSQSRTMMVKYRKRANVIIVVPKGSMTEEEIGQIEENESVQIVQVPVGSNIQGFTPPPLPPDVYNVDAIIKQDLQMATNMGALMFQAQPGQRTAAQANIAQSGLQLKAEARVDTVGDYTVDVARNMAQLMWQFYDREKMSEILGKPVTAEMWPDLPDDPNERRRIIHAELQLRIDAGSTAPPKDETVDRKQLIDVTSVVASIAPERLNKGELVKQLLKRVKFAKDLDRIVISGDEEERSAAMQENQLMMQGAPQVVSPNENHEIHIQVHSQAGGNPLVDEHILTHGQMLGMKQGGKIPTVGGQVGGQAGVSNQPQMGDMRPPMKSTNPEINRQGSTDQGDMYQSVQNAGVR